MTIRHSILPEQAVQGTGYVNFFVVPSFLFSTNTRFYELIDMNETNPLTNMDHTRKLSDISTHWLKERYLKRYRVDISRFNDGLDAISLYECPGYRIPILCQVGITGDDQFYQALSRSKDYDIEWK